MPPKPRLQSSSRSNLLLLRFALRCVERSLAASCFRLLLSPAFLLGQAEREWLPALLQLLLEAERPALAVGDETAFDARCRSS